MLIFSLCFIKIIRPFPFLIDTLIPTISIPSYAFPTVLFYKILFFTTFLLICISLILPSSNKLHFYRMNCITTISIALFLIHITNIFPIITSIFSMFLSNSLQYFLIFTVFIIFFMNFFQVSLDVFSSISSAYFISYQLYNILIPATSLALISFILVLLCHALLLTVNPPLHDLLVESSQFSYYTMLVGIFS